MAMDQEEAAAVKLLRSVVTRANYITRLRVSDPAAALESDVCRALAYTVTQSGIYARSEVPVPGGGGRIDLILGRPRSSACAIVEVKTGSQVYAGIGQLYYYRQGFGERKPHMVLAVPAEPSVYSEQLAAACAEARVILWAYTLHRREARLGRAFERIAAVPGAIHT